MLATGQRRAAGAAAAARQPDLQGGRRAARSSPLLPQVHVLLQQLVADGAPAGGAFHLGFNLALALLFIGFTGLVGAHRRPLAAPTPLAGAGTDAAAPPRPAGAGHAVARDHAARRARRCTRPTSSRRCCAASLPVIRNNDLRAGRGAAQARRHRRRALLGDQVLPDADLARGAVRATRAGAGPTSSRSRSTWSRSATSSSACCRTSRTRRSARTAASPTPAWPRSSTCTSGCSPTCAWA